MHTNPAIVGALSALVGAIIGAAASLAAAIYTQRCQNRLQRVVRETSKRETVYADFIMSASSLLLKAYVTEGFKLNGEEQHLIGLLNRMRFFAPPTIIDTADAVIRRIIEISLQPSLDLRKLDNGRSLQESRLPICFCHSARLVGWTWTMFTGPSPDLCVIAGRDPKGFHTIKRGCAHQNFCRVVPDQREGRASYFCLGMVAAPGAVDSNRSASRLGPGSQFSRI